MELAEPSVRAEASTHLEKMFNSDHFPVSENATVMVQLEPLPACLVHLVTQNHAARAVPGARAKIEADVTPDVRVVALRLTK